MKQCTWIKVTELRAFRKDDAAAATIRSDAEKFLLSAAALFEEDGDFNTRVSAAAVELPGVRGYETLAKAKRSAGERSKEIYTKIAIITGRCLCKKPQDDFGKALADDLGDILVRSRQIVREFFPAFGDDDCLAGIVVPVRPEPVEPPNPQGLQMASAASGSCMGPPTAMIWM